MEILRKVGDIELNKGDLMARGLFSLTDFVEDRYSFYFDEDTKDELMKMTDEEFTEKSKEMFHQSELN